MPLLTLLALNACTTAPKQNTQTQGSFDPVANGLGSHQNSGYLGMTDHGTAVITPTGRDTYNYLRSRYGTFCFPPVTNADSGLTPYTNEIVAVTIDKKPAPIKRTTDLWEMTLKALEDWGFMTQLAANPK